MTYGASSTSTMTAPPPHHAVHASLHAQRHTGVGSCRRAVSQEPAHYSTAMHRSVSALSDAAVASSIVIQPPTPEDAMKVSSSSTRGPAGSPTPTCVSSPMPAELVEAVTPPSATSPDGSEYTSPRSRAARFPSASFYSAGTAGSGGQDVRPPRRKRISPGSSPSMSPAGSRRTSQEDIQTVSSAAADESAPEIPRLETTSPSPSSTPRSPPVSSPLLPILKHSSASGSGSATSPPDASNGQKPFKHQLRRPGGNSFNSRREAAGRPTLASTTAATINSAGGNESASSEAVSALRLNLDILGRPKFDSASQTFVTELKPVPHTISSASGRPPARMIRKKSGELVRPALKMTLTPSYDANPLSAASNASVSSTGSSPFIGSRSLPATPSCPKIVHFDTQLERVRLFRSEQRPTAVSRGGSPSDENGGPSGSDGYPFPSTSDEEEMARRSLEIRLPNFPTTTPATADVYLNNIALTEDSRHLRGVVHVRNLTFGKRVVVRFTFDNWSTTSETTCTYHESIQGGTFDRFVFMIKLQDLMARIEEKTLFMCVRYTPDGNDDIWDSNGGQNYKVEFKKTKGMKAADLRDRKGSRRGTEWTDRSAANGGASSDRMADLKAHLGRLALDDPDDDDEPRSPGFRMPTVVSKAALSAAADRSSTANALLSPRSGLVPALSARYSFGSASIRSSPSRERELRSANVGTGWNGSPVGGDQNLPLPATPVSPLPGSPSYGTLAPTTGLRLNGVNNARDSITLPSNPPRVHQQPCGERPSFAVEGLPSSTLSSFGDWRGLGEKSPRDSEALAYSTRVVPTQPDPALSQPLKTFEPVFSPNFNEGALPDAFANAYSSPLGTSTSRFEYFGAAPASSPPFSADNSLGAQGKLSEPLSKFGASAAASSTGSTYSPHSFASRTGFTNFSMDGVPDSPSSDSIRSLSSQSSSSDVSTPGLTASSTPAESPISAPVGRTFSSSLPDFNPRLNSSASSYSDFVSQYCFYTGPSDAVSLHSSRSSNASHSSTFSMDSFFTPPDADHPVSTSGFSTPTNGLRADASSSHGGSYFGGAKSPSHSDSELDQLKGIVDSEGQKTPQQVHTPTGSFDSSPLAWATTPRAVRP